MSIATLLTRLSTARNNIITALGNKGVTATGHGIEDFPADIASITGGGGGGGGTVIISDTTDTHGGTIRTITPSADTTTIVALNATANNTYTAPTGYAYSPVTVNVGGAGGLVYETGTYTPTQDTAGPTINFANVHSKAPIFMAISNVPNSTAPDNSLGLWMYYDAYKITGGTFVYTNNTQRYGGAMYWGKTSGTSGSNTNYMFTYSSDAAESANYLSPKYWATNERFIPNRYSSTAVFKANRTYKWIAIWYD